MKKGFIIGFISALILLAIVTTILVITQTIIIILPLTTNLYESGRELSPDYPLASANINESHVESFSADSDVYVPVSLLEEVSGLPVKYDGETGSIYVGKFLNLKKSDFDTLERGMTMAEVEAVVGKAHYPLGSNLSNLCYDLADGRYIIVVYSVSDDYAVTLRSVLLIELDGSETGILKSSQ
jgi:hypothetical protein